MQLTYFFFCVKDEFGTSIYQSPILTKLVTVSFAWWHVSHESLVSQSDTCEWHLEFRQPQQNTSASGTFYEHLYVQKQVIVDPGPFPLFHVDTTFLIKAPDPCPVTLILKVDMLP